MKNQHSVHRKKTVVLVSTVVMLCMAACQRNIDTPILSCPEMTMTGTVQNTTRSMNLSTSTLFRQQLDSGGVKFLSIEAVNDSFKLVLNLMDGPYGDPAIGNDSLKLKTYVYSKARRLQGGLVVAAINNSADFDYLRTDTSSITITFINTKLKKVSGTFYFEADNHKVTGSGTFQNACYVTLP
ncbi:hypothetical protein SAMN04488128_1021349 [Chitinophaga eiseniae]|uniref:Uncharacterized protein n=1 Tax=Chitinophaga eiseniae TaxID=634771 RepID=A0A1T4RPB4_9BACT|nr:DUF6252 family protein [Chitinophaga eiseniae]SKA17598.1 hypothetical protein SAMN04488128_1021349 [Chitinophaga eiseniae]